MCMKLKTILCLVSHPDSSSNNSRFYSVNNTLYREPFKKLIDHDGVQFKELWSLFRLSNKSIQMIQFKKVGLSKLNQIIQSQQVYFRKTIITRIS